MNTEEKPPFDTPFEWIGGQDKVRALVERFYDLMDLEPAYAALRAVHGSELTEARQRLFWFLCGWLGGPQCGVSCCLNQNKTDGFLYRFRRKPQP